MHRNYSLADHNSFGIDVSASLFSAPSNLDQLGSVSEEYDLDRPFLVLGEGSNLLLTKDFEGLVLNPRMTGMELLSEDKEAVWVQVGAGMNWDRWVEHAVDQGWFGLENLSLIPGSVGSAPVQNIGAYGVELNNRFAWLDAWDLLERRIVRMYPDHCRFGYRTSIFKEESPKRYIITHVTFRLLKTPQLQLDYEDVRELFTRQGGSTPAHLREVIIAIRKKKLPDPSEYGNAGSFFKNPVVEWTALKCIQMEYPRIPFHQGTHNHVKIPAAWLIEHAGWKGVRKGRVGTWPGQPLVIVNYGGASGQEILDFSEEIRKDVDRKFGICLEREVNIIS